jgi:hypothetical protein
MEKEVETIKKKTDKRETLSNPSWRKNPFIRSKTGMVRTPEGPAFGGRPEFDRRSTGGSESLHGYNSIPL